MRIILKLFLGLVVLTVVLGLIGLAQVSSVILLEDRFISNHGDMKIFKTQDQKTLFVLDRQPVLVDWERETVIVTIVPIPMLNLGKYMIWPDHPPPGVEWGHFEKHRDGGAYKFMNGSLDLSHKVRGKMIISPVN